VYLADVTSSTFSQPPKKTSQGSLLLEGKPMEMTLFRRVCGGADVWYMPSPISLQGREACQICYVSDQNNAEELFNQPATTRF
jgi:hypothetical protein